MDPARHRERVVLVTGAASGIGKAAVLRLVAEGASVVACDVAEAGLKELAQEVERAGSEVLTRLADVTDQADVDALVAKALEAHGRIDVLANVAGIMDWMLPAHEVDDDTWQRVMAVNCDGPMRLSRAVLPPMMEHGDGAIVNVASEAALRGGTAGFAYTASKHALIGQTRSIAWVYATEGIRCNAVCPGGVDTGIGATAEPRSEWGVQRLGAVHGQMLGIAPPDQIAAVISWLASDEAANVNGAVVTADGGWAAG